MTARLAALVFLLIGLLGLATGGLIQMFARELKCETKHERRTALKYRKEMREGIAHLKSEEHTRTPRTKKKAG
jgi:hypothetical protein